jgi:hypothetical protein
LFVIALAAEAVKWPVVAPFAINRPEGTVRLALLLAIESTLHPTDALFSVTVHVLVEPLVKLAGAQLRVIAAAEVTRLMVTLPELPPRVAVTVADWLLETVVVVALKVAEVAAAATVTEPGAISVALVLVRVTKAPPVGAAPLRVMVQMLEALGPRLVGLQASEETSTDAVKLMIALAEVLL